MRHQPGQVTGQGVRHQQGASALGGARKTIGVSLLTAGSSTTDGVSVETASSYTPTANSLVLAFILPTLSGGPALVPTSVEGNSLTWDFVTNAVQGTNDLRNMSVYRAMGTPSAGKATFTFASSMGSFLYALVEFSNVDQSGTNGSGAIVQTVKPTNPGGSFTTIDIALPSMEHPNNVLIASMLSSAGQVFTEDPQFTEIEERPVATPATVWAIHWGAGERVCTPTFLSTTTYASIGIEIRAARL